MPHVMQPKTNMSRLLNCSKGGGGSNFNRIMRSACEGGEIKVVKLCKKWGRITTKNPCAGQLQVDTLILLNCVKVWGACDFDRAISWAAVDNHTDVIKLCEKWKNGETL